MRRGESLSALRCGIGTPGKAAFANSIEAGSVIPDGRIRITMVITGTKNTASSPGSRMAKQTAWFNPGSVPALQVVHGSDAAQPSRICSPHSSPCTTTSGSLCKPESLVRQIELRCCHGRGGLQRTQVRRRSEQKQTTLRPHPTPSQRGRFFHSTARIRVAGNPSWLKAASTAAMMANPRCSHRGSTTHPIDPFAGRQKERHADAGDLPRPTLSPTELYQAAWISEAPEAGPLGSNTVTDQPRSAKAQRHRTRKTCSAI